MSAGSASSGGVKGFFAHHVEKIITLVVFALAGVLFAMGYKIERLGNQMTPAKLVSITERAKDYINDDTVWPQYERNLPPPTNYVEVLNNQRPVTESDYDSIGVWTPHLPYTLEKRRDPRLFPPSKPEARFLAGAIALSREDTEDQAALEKLPFARLPDDGPKRGSRREEPDPAEDMHFDQGKHKTLSPELSAMFTRKYPDSWRPKGRNASKPVARQIVAVTALVPWKTQWDEFSSVFQRAVGFSASRDQPKYFYFEVERADVTADPAKKLAQDDWETVGSTRFSEHYESLWGGVATDVCPPEYKDEALTRPIPPLMLADYAPYVLHSKIPPLVPESEKEDKVSDEPERAVDPGDLFDGPGVGPMPGAAGRRRKNNPGAAGADPGMADPGMADPGMADPGMADPGMAAPGMGGGRKGRDGKKGNGYKPPTVDYKLVRFFDTRTEPGRSYRYRVRVYLNDPNNPRTESGGLQDEMLDTEVVLRLRQVRAADAEYAKRNPMPRQTYWRTTEWSEPSEVLRTPHHLREVFAGKAIAPYYVRITDGVGFDRSEPEGTVAATDWDGKYAVRVPVQRSVSLGSLLNFTDKADVLDPLSWQIHRIPDYNMSTNTIVLDIRGGDSLPTIDYRDEVMAPGEFLLFDSDGKMLVRNEIEDLDDFRMHLFIDDGPPRKAKSSNKPGLGVPGGDGFAAPGDPGGAPGGFEGFAPAAAP